MAAEDLVAEIQRRIEEMGPKITFENPVEDYEL